jgi:hypothetical protein
MYLNEARNYKMHVLSLLIHDLSGVSQLFTGSVGMEHPSGPAKYYYPATVAD